MISQPIFKQQKYIQSILLIITWLSLNTWTFQWFFESFTYTLPLNIIIVGIVTIVLFTQLRSKGFWEINSVSFRFSFYPVLLMLGGEISAIALKWLFNIPQLTLSCFILGCYGLLGLFISHTNWYRGLSIAAVAALVIPFSIAFNSGLGFPARVLTAQAVAQTLSDFHLSATSSHDIIVMENGIAQVDLPCSGMKSLWTGTVFLLGVTWLESRQLGFRWLLVAIASMFFLILANIVRVFTLVVVIEVWQQRQTAEILHLPLGVMGFVFASAITWMLLQKVPRHVPHNPLQSLPVVQKSNVHQSNQKPKVEQKNQNLNKNLNWLLISVITLGIMGQFQPPQSDAITFQSINLPPEIITEKLNLTPAEEKFFDTPANPLVQKVDFKSDNISGSMLMVASDTWQAHHPPELCFLGNGFKVDKMESKLINDSINARWLSLQNGKLSATYWFQSSQKTTDDFVSRIWDYVAQRSKTWVLVSVLFDKSQSPDSQEIQDFAQAVHQAINQNLNS